MLLPLFLLVQGFPFAKCQRSPQSFFLPLFFLPLQPQRFKLTLEVILLILQLADLCSQLLNDQFVAVPPLDQALQLILLLHQLLIPQLDPETPVFVVIADTAMNALQCLELIFQALSLVLDDLIVFLYPFSLSKGAIDVHFQPLYLFIIEMLRDQVISSSFYLSGLILKLLDSLAQFQVILLLLLQGAQLLLQLTHALVPKVPPYGLTKSLRTHFDYSFKNSSSACRMERRYEQQMGMARTSTGDLAGQVAVVEVGLDLEGLEGLKISYAEVSPVLVGHWIDVFSGVVGLIEVIRLLDQLALLQQSAYREFFDVFILEFIVLKARHNLPRSSGVQQGFFLMHSHQLLLQTEPSQFRVDQLS